MYGKQVKKSEKGDTTPIVFYKIDSKKPTVTFEQLKNKEFIYFLSIDPGTKNLALRIEKRKKHGELKKKLFEKLNIKYEIIQEDKTEVEFFDQLIDYTDQKINLILKLDVIIIERQPIINYRTARIMQHFITYFNIVFKNCLREFLPMMVDIRPELRRKWLKFPKNLNKNGIDQATKDIGRLFLEKQNDMESILILNKTGRKTDDLCVTVCQIETFLLFFELYDFITDESYIPEKKKKTVTSRKKVNTNTISNTKKVTKKKQYKIESDDDDEMF